MMTRMPLIMALLLIPGNTNGENNRQAGTQGHLGYISKYYPPILNAINLPRKDMQRGTWNFLFPIGHFDEFLPELIK